MTRISDLGIDRIDYVLDLVELSSRCDDKVSAYSYGMKQRLGIAQTLLHNPKIIVLDEPNNGLDPNGISDMIKLIKKLKDDGKTICLSTHNLKDVEQICTDFTIFKNGVNTVVSSMQSQLQNSHIWLVNVAEYEKAINLFNESELFEVISTYNQDIVIKSKSDNTLDDIHKLLFGLQLYKISKQSNLISYFNND